MATAESILILEMYHPEVQNSKDFEVISDGLPTREAFGPRDIDSSTSKGKSALE